MADLYVDLLMGLKPKADVRHYVRDISGKVIAESYGRTQDDITDAKVYNAYASESPLGNTIYKLRETVYNYHKGCD